MNVTLRRTLMVCVLALILAAITAGAASAAPRTVDPGTLTPPPPPDAECKQTGGDVICRGSFDESWADQPDSLLSCGRTYSTGSEHGEYTLRFSDGLLTKIFVKVTAAGRWSLSPTGEGPTVRFVSHRNSVILFAVPGDFGSVTEMEHGLDFRWWRPGSGVMLRLAGIFVFAPEGVTHHVVREFVLDEDENLVFPAKADAAMCEALKS